MRITVKYFWSNPESECFFLVILSVVVLIEITNALSRFNFSLSFSLSLFLVEALIAIVILLARRSNRIGGELGGPIGFKYATGAVLVGLWLTYVTVSTLEAYGFIEGF